MSVPNWSGCVLDARQCVSLQSILGGFEAPLKEEHAWAIAHQTLRTLASCLLEKRQRHSLTLATETAHVLLHKEGFVHPDTFVSTLPHPGRMALNNEDKAVSGVGLALFSALDFGMSQVEQRSLSQEIEILLEHMIALDEQEVEDEGIEDDTSNVEVLRETGSAERFLQACSARGSSSHYRNVCRALVSEALELSSFMERIRHLDEDRGDLRQLDLQDWARLWVQCVKDLRLGVKLKKIERSDKENIEYELTPYEMLMDDIRARRYKLNKVEQVKDSGVPRDAHDVILDFIRSRPPLRPVGERKLKPLRKESTPIELLMQSIRGSEARSSLRKTSEQPRKVYKSESSRTSLEPSASTRHRRVLEPRKVDVECMLNFDEHNNDDDDNDDNDDDDEEDKDEFFDAEDFYDDDEIDALTSDHDNDDRNVVAMSDNDQDRKLSDSHVRRVTKDLALHSSPSSMSASSGHRRRHSLSVCETPPQSVVVEEKGGKKVLKVDLDDLDDHHKENNLSKKKSNNDAKLKENKKSVGHVSKSDAWSLALKTLSLTLDEVIHIRSVLTKAELESLPIDSNIKQGLCNGKICFLCMKSRFSLFRWGLRCQLCQQQVCKKCATKMHIPVHHFSSTPASALSARATASTAAELSHSRHKCEGDDESAMLDAILAATSAPSSPDLSLVDNDTNSLNMEEMTSERLMGSSLRICLDCKRLVLQVIRAQNSLALINRNDNNNNVWTDNRLKT